MDRMSYTEWSGWDWRREPDSVRVIGLKGTNKTDNLSLTPRESSRAEELYQGSLGSTKTTSVSLGSKKTPLGSTKTPSGSTGLANTTLGSTGSVNTTFGSTGSANWTLGLARCTSGCLGADGTFQTTSGLDGTLKTTSGSLERPQGTSRTLKTAGGLLGRFKPTSEALRTTKALHTPIVDHIIMLCGFKDDSVMVECINKKEWNSLHDVVSIGINEPNTFHTVKSDGVTFKARPLSGDIRMLKGFLTFFKRMADTEGRLLDEDDVMDTFTTTDFKRYCRTMDYHSDMVAAGSVSSPSFETLIADGVFHVESALIPSVVVTTTLPPDTEEDQEGAVSMNGLVFGTSKSTETTSKTIKGMPETLGTSVTIHRSSKPTIGTPGASTVMVGSTCTTLSPIINHVIMLCGFESNSVFVEYINQEGWSKLSHVMSMSVTDVNAVHTVESNRWTFRSRPDEKEIQVFKGLLLYHARLSNTLNRPLNENDVMMLITKSVFDIGFHPLMRWLGLVYSMLKKHLIHYLFPLKDQRPKMWQWMWK